MLVEFLMIIQSTLFPILEIMEYCPCTNEATSDESVYNVYGRKLNINISNNDCRHDDIQTNQGNANIESQYVSVN